VLQAPGQLEVVEGRIVEIQVSSSSPRLERRLLRLLRPLEGRVLHLPSLTTALTKLQRLPGVGLLRTNLNRIGENSTRALLLVTAEPGAQPLQGEASFRNDGNAGSGQFRGLGALVKSSSLVAGDTLLVFGELNSDSDPELGYFSGSLIYTFPLNEVVSFTTAFGASRRTLVEAAYPFDDLTFRQLQGLGQFDLTLHESIKGRWFGFAGVSVNRSDAFLASDRFPVIPGGGQDAWLRTGFARIGLGYSGLLGPVALGGTVYGLQGIAGLSTEQQREELAFLGIEPGRSRAIGAQLAASWRLHSRWQLDLSAAAQAALNPLTNPMGFSLGSDNGLKGLPGQLVSGDSGVLGAAELAWSFWRDQRNDVQLVPFIGAGNVWTDIPGATLNDSVGAGGVLLRWLRGRHGVLEVGWVHQFQTGSRPFWGDWLLGNGVYTKIGYRF
jgi:hemolysin activation/secretion protein